MDALPPPLTFFLLLFSGWVNRQQQAIIDYLLEENRVLRAQRGSRRLRLTDDQRRRLAVKGKALGRRRLGEIAGIVTPRHDPPLVPPARRQEICRLEEASPRPPPHQAGPRRPRGPHGEREPDLGLHANPRRAEEPRPTKSPATRSRPSSRTTASSPHPSAARRRPGRRSWPLIGTPWRRPTSSPSRC